MSLPNITKDDELQLQEMTEQYQQLSQLYSSLHSQVAQMDLESKELDSAIAELKKVDEQTEVFKRAGTVLIKKTAGDALKELDAKKEILQVRINRLKNQEKQTEQQITKLQNQIQAKLGQLQQRK